MSGRGAIGSVLALGARGCQFESGRPDQSSPQGGYVWQAIFSKEITKSFVVKISFPLISINIVYYFRQLF